MKSFGGMGAVMSNMVLGAANEASAEAGKQAARATEVVTKTISEDKEDILVMDTKLKIIEILQVRIKRISHSSLARFSQPQMTLN